MKRIAYKELTLQQLRSFCETARLGSLKAAAESLKLSNPTVWEHVHALESCLEAQLIETHKRGCRLTETGRMLEQILHPIVHELNGLKKRLNSELQRGEQDLSIAATPRSLAEDLPEVVVEFKRQWPRVKLTLIQVRDEEVAGLVASGEVDLGLSADLGPSLNHSRLTMAPCYSLDHVLVMPRGHPLAKKKKLRMQNLKGHALVNAPDSIADPSVRFQLRELGLFETTIGRVEAFTAEAIRRYVHLGFGLGLVGVHPKHPRKDNLVERSMQQYFGPFVIHQITRKGLRLMKHQQAFIQTLKARMHYSKTARAGRSNE